MGVVGWVSTLEASSENVLVVTVDSGGDWLSCEVLRDSFLDRAGSSGMGSLGCEFSVTGRACAVATLCEGRMVRVVVAGPEREYMLLVIVEEIREQQHAEIMKATKY
jgi:hypothetical protein